MTHKHVYTMLYLPFKHNDSMVFRFNRNFTSGISAKQIMIAISFLDVFILTQFVSMSRLFLHEIDGCNST